MISIADSFVLNGGHGGGKGGAFLFSTNALSLASSFRKNSFFHLTLFNISKITHS